MSPVRIGRRTGLAAATLAAPAIARAQTDPNRGVRVVNAYSPGGTADVVCRNAAFRAPAVAARLAELGALTKPNTPAEFGAFRETQIAFFTDMMKTANIRIE